MQLTILGSGSFEARAERGQAGYAIRDGETQVIIDMGSGTLGRCCRAGLRPADTTALLVTHMHPDHVSDLVAFLFELKHNRVTRRSEDLIVYGPPTFGRVFDRLMELFGQWCIGEEYDVRVQEVERDRFAIGSLALEAFPVVHSVPAVGYRVSDTGGRVLVLTGDTGPDGSLSAAARDADVLIADCTLPGGQEFGGHLNAFQAGELAAAAGARTLILSHLSTEADAADVIGQARSRFGGQVAKAQDLLTIDI